MQELIQSALTRIESHLSEHGLKVHHDLAEVDNVGVTIVDAGDDEIEFCSMSESVQDLAIAYTFLSGHAGSADLSQSDMQAAVRVVGNDLVEAVLELRDLGGLK